MKSLLKNSGLNALSLFMTTQIPTGIRINGGLLSFIEAGLLFSLISFLLKPILSVITIPLRFLTFGLIVFLINAALLFVLTLFVPHVSVHPFFFQGASFGGFVIPKISVNLLFSYVLSAAILSLFFSFFNWIAA